MRFIHYIFVYQLHLSIVQIDCIIFICTHVYSKIHIIVSTYFPNYLNVMKKIMQIIHYIVHYIIYS